MKLGAWIKKYRKEHAMSMQDMADRCGFSKAYIGQLEKGINPKTGKPISPTIHTMEKIAKGVGMDLDSFLNLLPDDQDVTLPAVKKIDLQAELEKLLQQMNADDTTIAMFNGDSPMDEETKELMLASLKNTLQMSKLAQKRKDDHE